MRYSLLVLCWLLIIAALTLFLIFFLFSYHQCSNWNLHYSIFFSPRINCETFSLILYYEIFIIIDSGLIRLKKNKIICIPTFNKVFFNYKITFVNSQHTQIQKVILCQKTGSKSWFDKILYTYQTQIWHSKFN